MAIVPQRWKQIISAVETNCLSDGNLFPSLRHNRVNNILIALHATPYYIYTHKAGRQHAHPRTQDSRAYLRLQTSAQHLNGILYLKQTAAAET